eukprot:13625634-Alexandrium_andersonii.AAC.1
MLALRHECLRDPGQQRRIIGIIEAYGARGGVGTVSAEEAFSEWEPAPPPGAPNRSLWAPVERPAGP